MATESAEDGVDASRSGTNAEIKCSSKTWTAARPRIDSRYATRGDAVESPVDSENCEVAELTTLDGAVPCIHAIQLVVVKNQLTTCVNIREGVGYRPKFQSRRR